MINKRKAKRTSVISFSCTEEIYNVIVNHSDTLLKNKVNKKKYLYKYLYITHIILNDMIDYGLDNSFRGKKINSKKLTNFLGVESGSKILAELIALGIIEITGEYVIGENSYRYDITSTYGIKDIILLPVTSSDAGTIVKKVLSKNKSKEFVIRKFEEILTGYVKLNTNGHSYLINKYNLKSSKSVNTAAGLIISPDVFLTDLKNKSIIKIDTSDLKLIKILSGEFSVKRPIPGSRVYSNLTNLKRELRSYINFDGRPLIMTDISCSQVLLSVPLIIKEFHKWHPNEALPDDILSYKEISEEGLFYEVLAGFTNFHAHLSLERKNLKTKFFSEIFFSKVVNYSMPIKDAFKMIFPTVFELIEKIKTPTYQNFSIELQKLEASVMIDKVAHQLLEENRNILTLHDAIIANNEEDLIRAEQIITAELASFNTPLIPNFKRDDNANELFFNDDDNNHHIDLFGGKLRISIENYSDFKNEFPLLGKSEAISILFQLNSNPPGHQLIEIGGREYKFVVGKEDDKCVIRYVG